MRDLTPDRWNEAYAAYGDELEAFVYARSPVEAEEVLQDVWANLATAYEEGVEFDDVRAWLYRVARNRLTDAYRRRAARPAFVPLDAAPEPAVEWQYHNPADEEAVSREVAEAMELLPPDQREVFERNELGGETLREIAEDLGVPLKTVISRKGYARRRLQAALSDWYAEYFGGK